LAGYVKKAIPGKWYLAGLDQKQLPI
jgi:hypothetical protein